MKNSFYNSFPAFAPFALLFLMAMSQMNISDKNLLGHWSYEGTNKEEIVQYKSKSEFVRTESGIAFLKDGKLIVRQNAGWCGTPPVSYRNFDGTWKWIDENTVALQYAFWGGTINEQWEIISASKKNLSIKRTSFETVKEPFEEKQE